MTDPVIHIPSSTHEAFKAACRAKRVRMRDVADQLISGWITKTAVKKPKTDAPPQTNIIDPYMAPPFWAGRNGG